MKKKRAYEFQGKRRVDVMDSLEQKKTFFNAGSWQKDDLSIVFTRLARYFKKWEIQYFSSQKKKNGKMIFSLAWNIMM